VRGSYKLKESLICNSSSFGLGFSLQKEFRPTIDVQNWMSLMHFDVWDFRYLVLELLIAIVMDGYTRIIL